MLGINKLDWLYLEIGVCTGWIGQVEVNIFNQPTNGGLGEFQFCHRVADPPIYKFGRLVENLQLGWLSRLGLLTNAIS